MRNIVLTLFALGVLSVACRGDRPELETLPTPKRSVGSAPADAFLARVAEHCGQAFAGRIIANRPAIEEDPFAGKPLIMHVRECGDGEVRIPFHVGENRSRTWVLTRIETGLRLKHHHRHGDGKEEAVTMYGGDTLTPGTESRQEFPADDDSIAMFRREGLDVSVTNVWALEIEPGERFLYELSRPEGRLFQVEFDLSTPVDTPPPPWGRSQEIGQLNHAAGKAE